MYTYVCMLIILVLKQKIKIYFEADRFLLKCANDLVLCILIRFNVFY